MDIGICLGIIACFVISSVVPCIFVAVAGIKLSFLYREDSKGYNSGTVARQSDIELLEVGSALVISDAVPFVASAGFIGKFVKGGVKYGKVECHGAIAAVNVCKHLSKIAATQIILSVPLIDGAGFGRKLRFERIEDSQGQGNGAVAAMNRMEGMGILSRGGISLTAPCIRSAGLMFIFSGLSAEDGKFKGCNAVAAVRSRKCNIIGTGFRICLTVPCIANAVGGVGDTLS